MKTEEVPKTTEAKKLKRTELLMQEFGDRAFVGVDLPWRGLIKTVARQIHFFDQILALAELPEFEQWPNILAVSQRYSIPSMWRRVRPSLLENNAAALLTALAFSSRTQKLQLISDFFKAHGLTQDLRGRPCLRTEETKDIVRGIQIDKAIAQLQQGFHIKLRAKKRGGFGSGNERISSKLRSLGCDETEITATLDGRTLQDAGCRLYLATTGRSDENITLKSIRNSYARYKRARTAKSVRSVVPRATAASSQ
jgi:hypothetical protein